MAVVQVKLLTIAKAGQGSLYTQCPPPPGDGDIIYTKWMVEEEYTQIKTFESSRINPRAVFLRIFTIAFDRLF